ncbi:UDP-N-acetylmuramate dehydrogenase [Olivibacter sitiensis]|uniref:UDP-N-acetylmuramate dehydrogenase n=1 Tax=Olivibacter sitiensis TaxID=376470 RepID=UPI0003FD5766|nr:UDP-N-acetylmuramate dehydrogenase [Olivibacter sitiensis]
MYIKKDVSLKTYNTFGVDAKANYFVEIAEEDDLEKLHEEGAFERFKDFFILGGGSNTLFVADVESLVVHMGIRYVKYDELGNDVYIKAGAGVIWNDLVNYCVDRGFGGVENLSLIPGSVGAAPVQNIGAYGVELQDVFYSCRAFDVSSGTFVTLNRNDCSFAYRDSVFKHQYRGRYIITEVNLLLSKESKPNITYGAISAELHRRNIQEPTIRDVSQVVSAIRVHKLPDPTMIGNSGSFFKNPIVSKGMYEKLLSNFVDIVSYPVGDTHVKIAAGWLIEKCGWKGIKKGPVGTWKNQALVLVNLGNATGIDVYGFSEEIIDMVDSKFGIRLEREVNIVPLLAKY